MTLLRLVIRGCVVTVSLSLCAGQAEKRLPETVRARLATQTPPLSSNPEIAALQRRLEIAQAALYKARAKEMDIKALKGAIQHAKENKKPTKYFEAKLQKLENEPSLGVSTLDRWVWYRDNDVGILEKKNEELGKQLKDAEVRIAEKNRLASMPSTPKQTWGEWAKSWVFPVESEAEKRAKKERQEEQARKLKEQQAQERKAGARFSALQTWHANQQFANLVGELEHEKRKKEKERQEFAAEQGLQQQLAGPEARLKREQEEGRLQNMEKRLTELQDKRAYMQRAHGLFPVTVIVGGEGRTLRKIEEQRARLLRGKELDSQINTLKAEIAELQNEIAREDDRYQRFVEGKKQGLVGKQLVDYMKPKKLTPEQRRLEMLEEKGGIWKRAPKPEQSKKAPVTIPIQKIFKPQPIDYTEPPEYQ